MTLKTGLVGLRPNTPKYAPMEGVPVKVYGYCRSSRPPKSLRRAPAERPAEAPLGVESQRAAITERFPDATLYVDNARSGRDARRPGLQAMFAAELQAAQAAQATTAAFAVRRARGLTANGHAPYGDRVGEGGRIEPHPAEQIVVEHVMRFTRGRLWNVSGQELADVLNRAGFTNRAGRAWNRTTARKLADRLAQRGRVPVVVAS